MYEEPRLYGRLTISALKKDFYSYYGANEQGILVQQREFLGPYLALIWITLCCIFPVISFAESTSPEDDSNEPQDQIEDLRELLQVKELHTPEISGELTIDGNLDDTGWKTAAEYEIVFETYPARLEAAPVKTLVRIGRHEDSLVLAFEAFDPTPGEIQAPLRDRDGIELDDYVGVAIDPSGQLLETYEFFVNAKGVQGDWVRNRVDDTRARDWDADWTAAAKITDTGYQVEMKIPLDTLEISVDKNVKKRILLFKRHYPREVRHHLSAITVRTVYERPELPPKKIYLNPGLTLLNEHERDPEEDESWEQNHKSEVSLDLGYKPTPSFGFWATINPNFLEVEADLTDFSINDPFTPLDVEKRPFFLKSIENFGTPFDLVYTRNIEDPIGGVNASGSINRLTTGNFLVYDREMSLIVPGNLSSDRVDLDKDSTSGAFRYRLNKNPGTALGFISTVRTDGSDYYNIVGGVDFYKKFKVHNELRLQWLYSGTEYPEEIVNELCEEDDACDDPEDTIGIPGVTPLNEQVLRANPDQTYSDDAVHLRYKYNRREGYLTARYLDVGEDFRADLGYMTRVDYRLYSLSGGLNYYTEVKDKGKVRFRPSVNYVRLESQDGELLNESKEVWLNYWGLYQTWFRLGYRNRDRTAKRFLQNTLEIDGNSRYFTEDQLETRIETSIFKNFRFIVTGKIGTQIDTDNYRLGDLIEIKPEIRWSVTDHIELSIKDIYRQLDVEDGRLFTENYLGVTALYHLDTGSFFRLTIIDDYIKKDPDLYLFDEEDELEHDITAEILFAWKPTQLNTFFIGANFGAIENDALTQPELESMSFYIKYKRLFSF